MSFCSFFSIWRYSVAKLLSWYSHVWQGRKFPNVFFCIFALLSVYKSIHPHGAFSLLPENLSCLEDVLCRLRLL